MKNRTKRQLKLLRNWGIFLGVLLLVWIIVKIARPNINYAIKEKYFHARKLPTLGEMTYTDFVTDICDPDTEMSVYSIDDLMDDKIDGVRYTDGLFILNDRYYITHEDFSRLLRTTELDGYGAVTMVPNAGEALGELLAAAERETGQRFTLGESHVDGADPAAAHGNDCYLLDYYEESEHITGMSVDLLIEGENYRTYMTSPLAKWLQNNAWRFGFAVRYPFWEGEWTGVFFQPWHLKYVGRIHAALLYKTRMPLEEYVEKNYDIDRRTTRFYLIDLPDENGVNQTYVIYKQTAYEGTLFVPDTLHDVEVSFDNTYQYHFVTGILDK